MDDKNRDNKPIKQNKTLYQEVFDLCGITIDYDVKDIGNSVKLDVSYKFDIKDKDIVEECLKDFCFDNHIVLEERAKHDYKIGPVNVSIDDDNKLVDVEGSISKDIYTCASLNFGLVQSKKTSIDAVQDAHDRMIPVMEDISELFSIFSTSDSFDFAQLKPLTPYLYFKKNVYPIIFGAHLMDDIDESVKKNKDYMEKLIKQEERFRVKNKDYTNILNHDGISMFKDTIVDLTKYFKGREFNDLNHSLKTELINELNEFVYFCKTHTTDEIFLDYLAAKEEEIDFMKQKSLADLDGGRVSKEKNLEYFRKKLKTSEEDLDRLLDLRESFLDVNKHGMVEICERDIETQRRDFVAARDYEKMFDNLK